MRLTMYIYIGAVVVKTPTIIQHVSSVGFVLGITLKASGDTSLEYIGQWFCVPANLFIHFDICYSYIAGLGLAIYRILYIKHDHWVKYNIGERTLLCIILFGGLFLAASCVFVYNIHDYATLSLFSTGNFPNQLRTFKSISK